MSLCRGGGVHQQEAALELQHQQIVEQCSCVSKEFNSREDREDQAELVHHIPLGSINASKRTASLIQCIHSSNVPNKMFPVRQLHQLPETKITDPITSSETHQVPKLSSLHYHGVARPAKGSLPVLGRDADKLVGSGSTLWSSKLDSHCNLGVKLASKEMDQPEGDLANENELFGFSSSGQLGPETVTFGLGSECSIIKPSHRHQEDITNQTYNSASSEEDFDDDMDDMDEMKPVKPKKAGEPTTPVFANPESGQGGAGNDNKEKLKPVDTQNFRNAAAKYAKLDAQLDLQDYDPLPMWISSVKH